MILFCERVGSILDIDTIRKDFPILKKKIRGKPLCYLDNGASAQKPQVVIDVVKNGYEDEYTNVHRGYIFYHCNREVWSCAVR